MAPQVDELDSWIRMNVSFTPEQHEWLRQRSFQLRKSIAAMLREWVEEARLRSDPQYRLPYKQ